MSTTLRDLIDKEEEEEEAEGEGEGEGEESEDEDYVPNPASADEDSDDDNDAYDEDIVEVGGAAPAAAGKKRAAAAGKAKRAPKKPKKKQEAKKRGARGGGGGGIALSDDEDEAVLPDGGADPAEGASAEENAASAKPNVDDVWASMNGSAASTKAGAEAPSSTATRDAPSTADRLWAELQGTSTHDSRQPAAGASKPTTGALDIKALLAKTSAGSGSMAAGVASGGSKRMVEIQQRMDFCGEEVVVNKKVVEGSKEHLAYQQQQGEDAAKDAPKDAKPSSASGGSGSSGLDIKALLAKTKGAGGGGSSGGASGVSTTSANPGGAKKTDLVSSAFATSADLRRQMLDAQPAGASASGGLRRDVSLEFKAALPAPKLPSVVANKPTGLEGLLASIDGKKKMSTIEKSRHDWGNAKANMDEQTRDEVERFAKDGYLAKQAFLQRADQRQAEVARSNRRKGMGLKD